MTVFILVASAMVLFSIVLSPLASRIGAPILLIILAVGMLAGEDGPGRIDFDEYALAYDMGSLALAIILFSGGLSTRFADFRKAMAPAIGLATLGVALTAGVVGLAAGYLLFDGDWAQGMLLGAVVGSTDAAATFLLLQQRGVRLKGRVGETILVESGLNDPMAIFLTTLLVGLVDSGAVLSRDFLWQSWPMLALQMGGGAVAGLAGGAALAAVLNRMAFSVGLYPAFAFAGGLTVFAAADLAGASGFLAVYLCGLVLSARLRRQGERIEQFHDGLSWISQILMFLMLGLLVTPSNLLHTLVPGLLVAMVLMFVARPLAVALCLAPFRFRPREILYVGWVGLRGAVPIFLAIIPVISPGPVTVDFFNIVFVVVILSLVLQGWTIPVVARWFGVAGEPE